MSERDNADRLNRSWDDFVKTPRGARGQSSDTDPTVSELHAMDHPESPNPEFRTDLRQQLLRVASFRTGQLRAESVIRSHRPGVPVERRFNRWMELITIAVVVVLVGSALIWALQIRSDRDDELTPTFELAATSPSLIVASPSASKTSVATPSIKLPTQSPSASPEPTETVTPQPTKTPPALEIVPTSTVPLLPVATDLSDDCSPITSDLGAITSTLAEPSLPPELETGTPANSSQTSAVGIAVEEFSTCLNQIPIAELRSIVTEALQAIGVTQLDSFARSQQVAGLATPTNTISDVKLLPDGCLSAIISLSDGTQFVTIFEFDEITSTATLVHLYVLEPAEPIATMIVDNRGQPTDTSSDDTSSDSSGDDDDDDDGASGEDDDGGDDD